LKLSFGFGAPRRGGVGRTQIVKTTFAGVVLVASAFRASTVSAIANLRDYSQEI
jgi:hypothetical protein